jgi:hypothetical protein
MLRKFKFHYNLTRITSTWHKDLGKFFVVSLSVLLRMRNVSDKSCRENQNTHIMFNTFFFSLKSCRLWDNVEKFDRTRQATVDNMTHARCMLDNEGYQHTLRMCNTYCFSSATVVTRTGPSFMIHKDLGIPTVQEVIHARIIKHRTKLASHPNPLLRPISRGDFIRRLNRWWPAACNTVYVISLEGISSR